MAKRKSKSTRRGTKKAAGRAPARKKAAAKKAPARKKSAAKKAPARKKAAAKKAPARKKAAAKKAPARKKAAAKKAPARKKAAAKKAPARKKAAAKKAPARKKAAAKKAPARKKAAAKKAPARKKASAKKAPSRGAVSRQAKKASRAGVARKASASRSATPTRRTPAAARRRLNDFRLDDSVIPLGYTLALELDPGRDPVYRGTLQIDIELTRATRAIELHSADLSIRGACVEYGFASTTLGEDGELVGEDRDLEHAGAELASSSGPSSTMLSSGSAHGTADTAPSHSGSDSSTAGLPMADRTMEEAAEAAPMPAPPSFTIGGNPSPILDVPPLSPAQTPSPLPPLSMATSDGAAVERQRENPDPAPQPEPPSTGLGSAPASFEATIASEGDSADPVEPMEDESAVRVEAKTVPNPQRQTVVLKLAEEIPEGVATIELEFEGRLRDDLHGLYHARSGDDHFAFTQLEPVAARSFFPCFDEPSLKAPLQLSVRTHQDHTVISNAPVETVHFEEDGRKSVHFQPTQPLPSYLYALAVGPLEGSESRYVGETEVRIWHAPGKSHLVEFGAECAAESLGRLETYFDIAYPYEKLDLVAVPDFEIGAMENAGAVFFRETLLLLDPQTATAEEKKRAAEVIAHELAHMWFGDLVTMRWWDDLWLKESFATWMSYKVVDQWQPDWRMWNRFLGDREDALRLDSLQNTHSVYTEVSSPEEATEHFDAITYEKGASVVRMVECYLGEDAFRDGVRLYLQRHAGGVAEAADLWNALSESSGQQIDRVVKSWVTQEGHPLIRIKRKAGDGNVRLIVTQERFVEKPAPRSGKPAKVSGKWPIPWLGRVGAGERDGTSLERGLLEKAREEVELDTVDLHFVYGNGEEAGFWRVLHDGDQREALLANIEQLDPLERYGLVSHTWALVRAGHCEVTDLLEVAEALSDETDADVLDCLVSALSAVRENLVPAAAPAVAAAFERWLVDRFAPSLIELGWESEDGEDEATSLRRARILGLLADVAHWAPVQRELEGLFAVYLEQPSSVEPELADLVVQQAAAKADADRYEVLLGAYEDATTPQLAVRYLKALCSCRDRKLVQRTLALSLDERIATQDVARTYVWLLHNPEARDATWAFLRSKWKKVQKRLTPSLVSRVVAATPQLQQPKAKAAVRAHFKANPVPTARHALARAMERFDVNAALRRRAAPALTRWAREQ